MGKTTKDDDSNDQNKEKKETKVDDMSNEINQSMESEVKGLSDRESILRNSIDALKNEKEGLESEVKNLRDGITTLTQKQKEITTAKKYRLSCILHDVLAHNIKSNEQRSNIEHLLNEGANLASRVRTADGN